MEDSPSVKRQIAKVANQHRANLVANGITQINEQQVQAYAARKVDRANFEWEKKVDRTKYVVQCTAFGALVGCALGPVGTVIGGAVGAYIGRTSKETDNMF